MHGRMDIRPLPCRGSGCGLSKVILSLKGMRAPSAE